VVCERVQELVVLLFCALFGEDVGAHNLCTRGVDRKFAVVDVFFDLCEVDSDVASS
jgi:hypothetical protein